MLDQTVSVDRDSWKVALTVGSLQGVCNNPPAESRGPENGTRRSIRSEPDRDASRVGGRHGRVEAMGRHVVDRVMIADLGSSSHYSTWRPDVEMGSVSLSIRYG